MLIVCQTFRFGLDLCSWFHQSIRQTSADDVKVKCCKRRGKEQHIGSVASMLLYVGEDFKLLRANLSSFTIGKEVSSLSAR